MAKVPGWAPVKTRLQPPLTAAEADALAMALLLDRVDEVAGLAGVTPVVAFTPAAARPLLEPLVPPRVRLVVQRGEDLSERLRGLFDELLAEHAVAMVLDCDSAMLPMRWVADGLDMLQRGGADVVIGPSEDGGYWSIGLRRPRAELFDGIPWSTDGVRTTTLARATALGLSARLLPSTFDVDTPADLRRLRETVGAEGGPRRTAALLRGALAERVSA